MLTQDFQLKLKTLDDIGSFVGYASTYDDEPDLVGDIVAPGAFQQSIAHQGKGFPLLWSHDPAQPIGMAKVSDDPKGLKVDGSLLLADPAAQRAYAHLKNGSIKAMSIGYDVPYGEGKVLYSDDGTRTLKEIKLYEISLVAIPANPRAQVTSVKSLDDVHQVLHSLRDASDARIVAQLRSIDAELKRLLANSEDEDEEDDEESQLVALKAFAQSLKSLAAA